MNRPCRLVVVFLLLLVTLSFASSLSKCPPIPHWTLLSVNVTYSNDTFTPGVVSLEVSSASTSATDLFTCDLQFNSICLANETRLPSDGDVLVQFYINIELARITFNKTWDCGAGGGDGGAEPPETPRYVLGLLQLQLTSLTLALERLVLRAGDTC